MSRSVKAHILLVLVTLVWGATFVQIKDALRDISPLLFNAVRITLASALLALFYRRELAAMSRDAVRAGVLVGIPLWLGFSFQTTGLRLTTPSKSAFLTGFSVILVPVLLALVWRKKVNAWTVAGVFIAFVGLYFMTVPAANGSGWNLDSINRGDLLTIGCAVMFALQIIFMGRAMRKHRFEGVATVEAITCAAMMWASIPVLEHAHALWSGRVIAAILVTGILGTGAAFTIQAWAQQFTPPTHTALIFLLEPVFAWITSYIVLHERLGMRAGAGAVMILGGIVVSEIKGSEAELEAELGEEVTPSA
ncbi:MAG TPA: DMT family transporter [Terriglobales bacterium]|nr:DMT family transporter [Terriglobales bacterium]